MEKRFTEPNTSMKAMDERYQKLEYFDTDTGRFWVSPTDSRAASNLAKELEKERRISTILGNFYHSFPMCIKRRGTATIVEWCDGTVTKIVRQKDAPGDYSIFEAFCVAYAKKMFGCKSMLERVIQNADEQTLLNRRADMEKRYKKLREEENARKARKRAKRKQKKEATC